MSLVAFRLWSLLLNAGMLQGFVALNWLRLVRFCTYI